MNFITTSIAMVTGHGCLSGLALLPPVHVVYRKVMLSVVFVYQSLCHSVRLFTGGVGYDIGTYWNLLTSGNRFWTCLYPLSPLSGMLERGRLVFNWKAFLFQYETSVIFILVSFLLRSIHSLLWSVPCSIVIVFFAEEIRPISSETFNVPEKIRTVFRTRPVS